MQKKLNLCRSLARVGVLQWWRNGSSSITMERNLPTRREFQFHKLQQETYWSSLVYKRNEGWNQNAHKWNRHHRISIPTRCNWPWNSHGFNSSWLFCSKSKLQGISCRFSQRRSTAGSPSNLQGLLVNWQWRMQWCWPSKSIWQSHTWRSRYPIIVCWRWHSSVLLCRSAWFNCNWVFPRNR